MHALWQLGLAGVRSREVAEHGPLRRNPLFWVCHSEDNARMRILLCRLAAALGMALAACNNPMLLVDVEIDYLPMGTTN